MVRYREPPHHLEQQQTSGNERLLELVEYELIHKLIKRKDT